MLPPAQPPRPIDQAEDYPAWDNPAAYRAWVDNPVPYPDAEPDVDGAPLTEHLEELRLRLIKSLIAVALGAVIGAFLTFPLLDMLKHQVQGVTLIRTQVTEMITTYMKVSVVIGIVIAMPVILYQGIMFVSPGLTKQERRILFMTLPAVVMAFLIGSAFSYFVLLPPALYFLVHFGEELALPLIRIGDYIDTIASMVFWVGLTFETPLVIFLLARLGVVTPRLLARYRRHAAVASFVLGAIITPTFDPINQTLVSIPLIVLYEFGIVLAKIAMKQRTRAASS